MSKFILVALTRCTDPAREAEFNDWYTNVHVRDALTNPGFLSGTRYRILDEPLVGEGRNQYLAIYEMETDDPAAWMATLREHSQGDPQQSYDAWEIELIAAYEPITGRITAGNPAD